ncbi:hypothetical protein [Flavobacterium foetidum]|uniref:hypothetical protein n=1 Tax=Flavobacterium foetidum TaxID=2026681 RepID=UPI0010750D00|nr:hypothetical protein [Flavobacterium foetidum]KAF2516428.1 hypothetical protein E0W73_04885 [Flavobacterium foetidum]
MSKKVIVFLSLIFLFGCTKEKSDIVPSEYIPIDNENKISAYNYNGNLEVYIPVNLDNEQLVLKKYSELILIVRNKWKFSTINIEVLNGSMNVNFVNKIKKINSKLFLINDLLYTYDADGIFINFPASASVPLVNAM